MSPAGERKRVSVSTSKRQRARLTELAEDLLLRVDDRHERVIVCIENAVSFIVACKSKSEVDAHLSQDSGFLLSRW